MREKQKKVWRALAEELARVKRKARIDYQAACDRWDHFMIEECPDEIKEEWE